MHYDRKGITMAWTIERQQEYFRQRRADQKARGICQTCGQRPMTKGLATCEECRTRSRDQHREYVKSGVCSQCGQQPSVATQTGLKASKLCEVCYFKFVARKYCRSIELWTRLRDIMIAQDYRCSYTGDQLILGLNTSLDHIYPKTKFPELARSVDNMQWVCLDINTIKHDLTPDEFERRMVSILTHLGYTVTRQ